MPSDEAVKAAVKAIREGICNRINENNDGRSVKPNELVGAFYRSEIEHHSEVVADLLDKMMAQARLEEAKLWLKATATAPLCNVSQQQLILWEAERIAELERLAGRGK